ncbi:MAG: MATE family efflux transporter, partial [Bacteroidales bacterium]|nr:MATE family efflux transporter [Bacteroidales bacterium]
IIAMIASSLYNMVDSIFIGQGCGALAISGLAVSFPLMNLSTAFGTLVGAGATTLISVLLGQKNYKMATRVLGNVVILNVAIGLLFAVVALAFLDPILNFFGASPDTIGYARDYMVIILLGNIITHCYFGLNNVMRASGNPRFAMGLTIFTVTLNTILDPLFIFVFNLGVQGAAIATVLAQAAALVFVVRFFCQKKNFLHFTRESFHFEWRIAKESLSIGVSPFLMNSAACLVTIAINKQLQKYGGDYAIGAYGIVNRIAFLFLMVNMGFNQGMQPIAGYNYGARLYSRMKDVLKRTIMLATAVTTTAFLVGVFCPRIAVGLFTSDSELLDLSAHCLQIGLLAFPMVGFQIVVSNFFQCIGMVRKSILLSLSRQIICLIPLVYILPTWFGIEGVWYSFPISDFLATLLAVGLLVGLLKKINRLKDGDEPTILGSTI